MAKYSFHTIFVHWSATSYDWLETGDYHTIFNGKTGEKHPLTDYGTTLYRSTFGRNEGSVSVSMACMGEGGFDSYPPTDAAISAMCKELAILARDQGWSADEKFLEFRIMTHAEAAGLRDHDKEAAGKYISHGNDDSAEDAAARAAGLPHSNYGPSHWNGAPIHPDWPGGDVTRWDWWISHKNGKGGEGGYELRKHIVQWMLKLHQEALAAGHKASPGPK